MLRVGSVLFKVYDSQSLCPFVFLSFFLLSFCLSFKAFGLGLGACQTSVLHEAGFCGLGGWIECSGFTVFAILEALGWGGSVHGVLTLSNSTLTGV